jgi:hypothetical protein
MPHYFLLCLKANRNRNCHTALDSVAGMHSAETSTGVAFCVETLHPALQISFCRVQRPAAWRISALLRGCLRSVMAGRDGSA